MGHHCLDYIAALATTHLGVNPDTLHTAARDTFAATAPNDHLPPTVFYYDDILRANGEFKLVDTARTPTWR